jgi:hypothetical protein
VRSIIKVILALPRLFSFDELTGRFRQARYSYPKRRGLNQQTAPRELAMPMNRYPIQPGLSLPALYELFGAKTAGEAARVAAADRAARHRRPGSRW